MAVRPSVQVIDPQVVTALQNQINQLQNELRATQRELARAQLKSNRYDALRTFYHPDPSTKRWFHITKNPTTGNILDIQATRLNNIPGANYYSTIEKALDAYIEERS